jgi:hypothetical protein
MGTNIVFDGVTYSIPATNDVAWGTEVTKFLKGLPAGILSRAGGQFHLTTADLDFGLSKGLAALYFKSKTANIANTGVLRLAQADFIAWRNEAGSADLALKKDDTNFLTWNDIQLLDASSAQTLTNKTIDADLNTVTNIRDQNVAADAAIDYPKIAIDDGEIAYQKLTLAGQITNSDISPTANIDGSKVNTDFGSSQVITSGGLRLGTSFHVTLNADPSEDYDFIFPDTDGTDGQALVRQSGELVWASIPGLSLPHHNITVGDAGGLPQPVDTSSVGDILADDSTGLTIKDGAITDIMISGAAAIDTTKLATLTASSYVITDSSGYLDTTTINPLDKSGDTMTGLLGLDSEGLLFDTVTASPAAPVAGQTFWDDMNHTIATKLSSSVTLQHGQENHLFVKNDSGSLIPNGAVVYVNAANTARATIRLARADSNTSDRTIGMVTADIADNAEGYVTTFGLVHDLTTNVDGDGTSCSDGDPIYLSATTAGEWVKTAPTAPNHNISLGQVINAAGGTAGTIFINVNSSGHLANLHDVGISGLANRDTLEYDSTLTYWKNVPSVKQYTNEETGFVDPAGVTVTYDSTARTITLTHSTAIIFLYQGIRFNLGTSWTSTAHSATLDTAYFLSFNGSGVASWATVFPGFDNGVYVAYVNYGTSNKYAIRECHGLMNWQAWEEFHRTIGTYRVSGGLVPAASWVANTYTTAAVTPAVDSAVIQDEDLPTTIPAFADGSTYTRIHFDTGNVVFSTASSLPYPNNGTDIQYNQNPTTGTALTAITTNARFVNIYGIFVPATADAGSQAYRILWMTGQQIYTTLAAAQGEDFRTLSTGNLANIFPEFVPFIRVTYERQTGGGSTTTFNARIPTNGVSYIVGTRAGLTSLTGFTPTDHNTLTGRSDAGSHPSTAVSTDTTNFNRALSVSDTTVQAALDTIDNTMVTPTSTDTLTNKYFDGGTASSTNKLKLPNDTYANLVALAGKEEGQLYYATDTDKIYSFDGTNLKVDGGGLLTVPKSFSDGDFTAEAGKHYLVDMTGVNALRTITLPAGTAEAVVKISCVNNTSTTYPLTIDGNGTEKIFYNATQNLNVSFPYAEQWCELSWDTNDSQWIVNDGSTPLSGTWSGSLDITGALSFPITNLSNAQATSMGLKQYLHGTTYNGGIAPTVSGTGVTPVRAVFTPYQLQDGTWKLRGLIVSSMTSGTSQVFAIDGITTKNVSNYYQNGSCQAIGTAPYLGTIAFDINGNTGTVGAATTSTSFRINFDIELESKPTWAY